MPDPETLAKLTARELWSLGCEAGWAEGCAEGLAEARAEGVSEVYLSFAQEYLPDEQFRAPEHRPTEEIEAAVRAALTALRLNSGQAEPATPASDRVRGIRGRSAGSR